MIDPMIHKRNEMIINMEAFLQIYEQAESDAIADFSHKFVVERAVVADKKDKPKRMIIVLVSTIGGFLFGLFYLLVLEKYRELKTIE